jgi:hypothetical protein
MNPLENLRIRAVVHAAASLVCLVGRGVHAQTPGDLAQAQARYNTEIARCNSGTLAAPSRADCVRAAGAALDRAQGTPAVPTLATTTDGRATVMTPTPLATGTAAPSATNLSEPIRTSTDGRATVVAPANGASGGVIPQ